MSEPIAPAPPPPEPKYTTVDYLFQFIIITAGVLIALLLNGLVEWNSNRQLVAAARDTIRREITYNKNDLDATIEGLPADIANLEVALKYANERLGQKKTIINELNLHLNLADLVDSAWRTAERTGALSHMDYEEVQRLSMLYDMQELIVTQQRTFVSQLADVSSILDASFDPDNPDLRDLAVFRERLMRLRAALLIHSDMTKRLAERYAEVLGS